MPTDRWVFPQAGTDAHDHSFVSNRDDLHSSPAIRIAGRPALELAGIDVDDVAHVDLYSCFPSAVQIAAARARPRPRPAAHRHRRAELRRRAVEQLRDALHRHHGRRPARGRRAASGLCTANGGFMTKHAFGVYCTEPPAPALPPAEPQAEVDALPAGELAEDHAGAVDRRDLHGDARPRGPPERRWSPVRTPDGRRAWGFTTEPTAMKSMTTEEFVGRSARLGADGALDFGS